MRPPPELGDYQTPAALGAEVLRTVAEKAGEVPRCVVDPTCGRGNLLAAAAAAFPGCDLRGLELQERWVREAARLRGARVVQGDVFAGALAGVLADAPDPLWVVGNPPWVTASAQGRSSATNLPSRRNLRALGGLAALTGPGDFDVSEAVVLEVLAGLGARPALIAMLLKTSVARALFARAAGSPLAFLGLWPIDARAWFGATVDASLLAFRAGAGAPADGPRCPRFAALGDPAPVAALGIAGGAVVEDVDAVRAFPGIPALAPMRWRSGLKHDCAPVMELHGEPGALRNGLGENVDVEAPWVFPLLKGGDLAAGRLASRRWVVVPQRRVGEDTRPLAGDAPRLWGYLTAHRARLDARKSRIYLGKPPFSVFGVGPYSFLPYKVAVSGLHHRPAFRLVEPRAGIPVILDDTCAFLGFERREEAERAWALLEADPVKRFLAAHAFRGAKRPVTASLLSRLGAGADG